jgi:chromate reductase, NAD(P)H dehydrogenase (quinone)
MRILAISGSLRRDSHNTKLLRAAADLLPPGAELVVLDPEALRAIPHYDEDLREQGEPAPVRSLRDAVNGADAILVSTPEYNHSLPGALKNAIDWLSRPIADSPFKGKTVAVVGASTGMFGAVWAQAEARKVFGAVGGSVIDAELPVVFAHEQFDAAGGLVEDDVREALREQLAKLVEQAAPAFAAAA